MSATKGYYSVIQYCPDASRMEAANVGVLLLCPDIGFVRARTAAGNDRIRRFFKGQAIDLARVNAAKRAIERRVESESARFRTPEDLVRFAVTRGNDIILTAPRPTKVLDPDRDLDQLFDELVGGRARRQASVAEFPELDAVVRSPSLTGRVLFDQAVSVPVLGRPLRVPYAFRNGVLNLIKPQRFANDDGQATTTAMRLAVEGDLLARYPVGDQEHRLVVVSAFEGDGDTAELQRRIHDVLSEFQVRVFHGEHLGAFAEWVEREAHGHSET